MKPAVSVILTTHNGVLRGFLEEAIQSVLIQTYKRLELIIVDDGSTDATRNLCESYSYDPRVIYHHQANQGPSAARNAGLKISSNEYVCFLDDDDFYEPDKIAKQITFFTNEAPASTGMIYTGLLYIDEWGKEIGSEIYPAAGNIYERLFFGNKGCAPSSCMIKRSVLDRVGWFNEELRYCEDYDLWFRLAKKHLVFSLDECLVRYRVHGNKLSMHYKEMHEHQEYVLLQALKEAPEHIRNKKEEFYHRYHVCCSHQYLGIEDFFAYRRHFKLSKQYARPKLADQLRYLLSYFPPLFKALKQIKLGCSQ